MHRHRIRVAAAVALAAVAATAPASAATSKPSHANTVAALPTAGNGVFQIRMQDKAGLGFGTFTVTAGGRDVLYSGSGPGTSFAAVGSVSDGAAVTIHCQKRGQTVTGKFGTSSLWDKIDGGFVSDTYVFTGTDGRVAPDCP